MRTFIISLFFSLSIFAKDPIRVIIVAGQSNADGRAETKDIPKEVDLDFEDFYFFHGNASGNAHESCPSNKLIKLKPGSGSLHKGKNHFGIEIGIALHLKKVYPGEKFYIIKYAKGGSSLYTDWNLEKGPHLEKFRTTVENGLKEIKKEGYQPEIRAFTWHQGESDSKPERAEKYGEKLSAFLKTMVNDLNSTMAIAVGHINLQQKLDPKLAGLVIQGQKSAAEKFAKLHLIESDKLALKNDQMHFNTEGMLELGKRYGKALAPELAKREVFNVWPNGAPDNWKNDVTEMAIRSGGVTRLSGVTKPILTFYPVKDKNRPVVMVCPGGGYKKLAYDKEGTELAEWFNSQNINAFVLKYRLPSRKDTRHIPPLQDAQRSISFIRSMAKKYAYNGDSVGMMGFSAGGHLTVMTSLTTDRVYKAIDRIDKLKHRPDFSIPVYPAYLSNGKKLSDLIKINSEIPETFIMHAEDDTRHFPNSPIYSEALKAAGVPVEFFRCKTGGHGHGIRQNGKEADKWPSALAAWLENNIN